MICPNCGKSIKDESTAVKPQTTAPAETTTPVPETTPSAATAPPETTAPPATTTHETDLTAVTDPLSISLTDLAYVTKTKYVAVGSSDRNVYTGIDGTAYTDIIYPTADTATSDWADPTGVNNKNEGYIIYTLNGKYKYRIIC